MRNRFERDLKSLSDDLIKMGSMLELALANTALVMKEQNDYAYGQVVMAEKEVDKFEQEIQANALRILCNQQPVAKDLRVVSTALNMITDMERISDQTVDISEIAMLFRGKTLIKQPTEIIEMIEKCSLMVKRSIDAFVVSDLELANKVIASDDEVDNLFLVVRDEIIGLINEDKSNGEQAIDFIMIAKYLERIADHAVNIAEWVIFNITGEHKNATLL